MAMVLQDAAPPAGPTEVRRGHPLVLIAVLLVVAVAALGLFGWYRSSRGPAYGPDAVNASATADVMTPSQAQRTVSGLIGPGRLNVPSLTDESAQMVVGQVTFSVPDNASRDDMYGLVVIDERQGKPLEGVYGVGPPAERVGQGWDGRFNQVAVRFPWLSSLAPVPVSGGWTDPGQAVIWPGNATGPVTFVALLRSSAPPVTDVSKDLTIALVYFGANGSMWAQRLPVSSLQPTK